MTPFIGAGVGGARVQIANFTDINTPTNGVAYGDTVAKWNFAWALHAGCRLQGLAELPPSNWPIAISTWAMV